MKCQLPNHLLLKSVIIAVLLLLGIGAWSEFSLLQSSTIAEKERIVSQRQSSNGQESSVSSARRKLTGGARGNLPIMNESPKSPLRNFIGIETGLYRHQQGNDENLTNMPLDLSAESQAELVKRMNDLSLRWETRMLYAVVLANQDNAIAHNFLIDQYHSASDDQLPDVLQAIYWVWRMPWNDERVRGDNISIDMTWAESTMLAALSDKRLCKVDTPMGGKYFVRDLAVSFGNFDMILTNDKCNKVVPVLCSLLMDSMRISEANQLFADGHRYNAQRVMGTLAEWDDPAVEPVMLEVVRRGVIDDMAADIEFQDAMDWLVSRKNQEVIGLVLDDLDHDSVFNALEETRHEPYLQAIREKLTKLGDGDLKDHALYRQRSARANAILILK
jgi:hypothetical protein